MNATSLHDSVDALQRLAADARRIGPLADEMDALLQEALDALRTISGDIHARNAESEIRAAQSALREARAVWLNSYVRGNEDLCRRIVS